ncbi:neurexin-1a-like [Antedon mediterranea]|uniref:neurexin-1a-like n=1 Tax=Antedon mediterranea TaxID=105859 RepID=UPI003AF9421F
MPLVNPCCWGKKAKAKKTAAGTFDGDAYFYYDLSNDGIDSSNDDITFEFRTQHTTGLILGAKHQYDYLYVGLSDGHLHVKYNVGSGAFDRKMGWQSLADNSWHRVNIRRTSQEVIVTINDTLTEKGQTGGDYSTLTITTRFYVGGIDNTDFGDVDNFRGNIRQLFFSGSKIELALLELAEAKDPRITVMGNLVIGIEDVEELDPITFRTPESVLIVPKWEAGQRCRECRGLSDDTFEEGRGSLSFSFRTIEPNGLLMYSRGAEINGDFFAVELFEGRLFVIINLGGGMTRSMPYMNLFNDGSWHNVVITRMDVITKVQVDVAESKTIDNRDNSKILNLEDDLFLGGVDNRENAKPLPMEVFSITRQSGYVGCMRNLVLNGLAYNIAGEVQQQGVEGIKPMCKSMSPMCSSGLCRNGGQCSEGWNRFICDCSMTDYIGHVCDDIPAWGPDATVLSFNGNQTFLVDHRKERQTKSEDITIRFQTYRPSSALLTMYSNNAVDVLKLELDKSRILFSINFGTGVDTFPIGEDLADGEWHTVKLQRKQEELTVILDGGAEQVKDLNRSSDAELLRVSTKILDFRFIELGMNSRLDSSDARIPFIGLIDQFVFNSRDYIDLASGDPVDDMVIRRTASFSSSIDSRTIRNPITFKTKNSYLILPSPNTYPSLSIFFHFRTMEPNGLMMLNQGDGKDFIAVEMYNGYLHYLYNFGDQPVTLRANSPGPLNDNKWHEVYISSNIVTRFKVDNSVRSKVYSSPLRRLNLIENVYFGGVERAKYNSLPENIRSRDGYHGCFASLEFNGHFKDMFTYSLSPIPETVVRGCSARVVECTDDLCLNGGKCIEGWENVYCECDATSYQGDRCQEAGTTYMFGSYGGLISLEFTSSDWESTEEDAITFGFATYSENAVLMRVESATQTDYIEINLSDGIVVAVYKLGPGSENVIPTSVNKKFNDGSLHVVRFYRKGGNTTLIMDQIDNYSHTVPASDATVFDDQAKIYIGGQVYKEGRRKRRQVDTVFVGLLSGARLNKIKPLELAESGHPRTSIQGNVTLIENPTEFLKNSFIIPTPVSLAGKQISTTNNPVQNSPTVTTDIFFSNVECNDDEECETTSGSGMEGVFVPTGSKGSGKISPVEDTSSGIFERTATTQSVFICADDDEDCVEGSGATQDPFINKNPTDSIITATIVINGDRSTSAGAKGTGKSPSPSPSDPDGQAQTSTSFIEQTGMIIGIAAGGVVIMLLVILLLYKYRNRSEGSYKINESRNFDLQTVRASLLPTRNGTIPAKAPKSQLPPGYASKEWYV